MQKDSSLRAIVDPWRLLNIALIPANLEYISPGKSHNDLEWPTTLTSKL